MRDLSPAFAAAVASSAVTPAIMVYLDLLPTALRAWTGLGTLSWSSHDWSGFGMLAALDPVEEYSEIRAGAITLSLTHIPSTALSELASLTYKSRLAEIYLALFAGDTTELVGVELLMRGQMDTLKLKRGPDSSSLSLTVVNELTRLRDSWAALYTDPHQQALHPGDTALRFVPSLQDFQIKF